MIDLNKFISELPEEHQEEIADNLARNRPKGASVQAPADTQVHAALNDPNWIAARLAVFAAHVKTQIKWAIGTADARWSVEKPLLQVLQDQWMHNYKVYCDPKHPDHKAVLAALLGADTSRKEE